MDKVDGIILSIANYKNADCVFNILTKEKLITVLGRGTLNQNNRTNKLNNPLICGEFDLYQGPTNGLKLRDCKVYKHFNENFKTYEDMMIYDFLVELTFKIIVNNEDQSGYYDLLYFTLDKYNDFQNKYALIIYYFAHILILNGLRIKTDSCVVCGEKSEFVGIDFIDGGVICKKDFNEESTPMTSEEIKLYEIFFENSFEEIKKVSLSKEMFFSFVNNLSIFLVNGLDIKLNSIKLLETI